MSKITYEDAGVDIAKGNRLVDRIKPFAKMTKRLGADSDLGGFGGLFDLAKCKFKDPILVAANDGVGTKLKIAHELGKHDTIGEDLVAMCVNDLIVQGAEPLFFLDYFACGKLDDDVASIVIESIANGCKKANCALIGGETAEMPGMYQGGEYDLAGFAVGAVEREGVLPRGDVKEGDIIIGLKSSGVHSNGYSLVRKILEVTGAKLSDKFENSTLGEVLLTPTKIYVKPCLAVIKHNLAKALCHITGGGFIENIPRILPDNLAARIDKHSWQKPSIFNYLQDGANVSDEEMLRTFNCGIGMVMIVDSSNAAQVKEILEENGEEACVIGEVTPRKDRAVEI